MGFCVACVSNSGIDKKDHLLSTTRRTDRTEPAQVGRVHQARQRLGRELDEGCGRGGYGDLRVGEWKGDWVWVCMCVLGGCWPASIQHSPAHVPGAAIFMNSQSSFRCGCASGPGAKERSQPITPPRLLPPAPAAGVAPPRPLFGLIVDDHRHLIRFRFHQTTSLSPVVEVQASATYRGSSTGGVAGPSPAAGAVWGRGGSCVRPRAVGGRPPVAVPLGPRSGPVVSFCTFRSVDPPHIRPISPFPLCMHVCVHVCTYPRAAAARPGQRRPQSCPTKAAARRTRPGRRRTFDCAACLSVCRSVGADGG